MAISTIIDNLGHPEEIIEVVELELSPIRVFGKLADNIAFIGALLQYTMADTYLFQLPSISLSVVPKDFS